MALGFAIAAVGLGWAMTPRGVDFAAFYSAGRAVWRGELRHVYDVGWIRAEQRGYSSQAYAYLYPPACASVFAPFALLPFAAVRALWTLTSLAAGYGFIRVARRWMTWDPIHLAILGLCFAPVVFAIVLGQTSFWMLLVWAYVTQDHLDGECSWRTGLLAGATLWKPHLVVALALTWCWRRRWAALSGLLLAGAAVAAVSALLSWRACVACLQVAPGLAMQVKSALDSRGSSVAVLGRLGAIGIALTLLVVAFLLFASRKGSHSRSAWRRSGSRLFLWRRISACTT